MKATQELADKIARDLLDPVNAVLLAKAHAECERERVDAIQRRVLSEGIYTGRRNIERGKESQSFRVTEPKDTWKMDEGCWDEYFAKMQAIHLGEGFEKAADGCCPALTAESLERDAKHLLVEMAQNCIPGVTLKALLSAGLEKYEKYIHLLIGVVVSSPHYKDPLETIGS